MFENLLSREPDTNRLVIQTIYRTGLNRHPLEIRPLLIGLVKLVATRPSRTNNNKMESVMGNAQYERARAHERAPVLL